MYLLLVGLMAGTVASAAPGFPRSDSIITVDPVTPPVQVNSTAPKKSPSSLVAQQIGSQWYEVTSAEADRIHELNVQCLDEITKLIGSLNLRAPPGKGMYVPMDVTGCIVDKINHTKELEDFVRRESKPHQKS